MGLWEVLTGQQPLFRPRGQVLQDIEADYERLINSTTPYGERRVPFPSQQVWNEALASESKKTVVVSVRFTISIGDRVKIFDTGGERKRVYLRVIQNGVTIFVSHNPNRLLNSNANTQEGVPITSANLGMVGLGYQTLQWFGEMWATSDTDGAQIDVESE
jgi:hypothetical protein